jgi:penicillin-binding protein 2
MNFKPFYKNRRKTVREIDEIYPEDILIDSQNLPSFYSPNLEGKVEKTISKNAGYILIGAIVIFFSLFCWRLFDLQITNGDWYKEKSLLNQLRFSLIFTKRGAILDRNNLVIAENESNKDLPYMERKYRNTKGIGNILGFIKYPQVDKNGFFYQTELKGIDGIEKAFDKELGGENGVKIVEVDSKNKIQSESTTKNPIDGKDVKLSLDYELSKKLYDIMESLSEEKGFGGGVGALMDTETGEIIALSSFPDYSPQIVTDGKNANLIKQYSEDSRKPYLNKAVDGLYTPGSIVKPFLATGVLNEQLIDPLKTILSTGSISIPNEYDPEKKSVFTDWKAHGEVDMRKALAVSSNVYFYEVGGGFENQKGLGIDGIERYLRLYGFGGEIDDVFLKGQKGIIPNPMWKEQNFDGDPWRIGDTYNTSIGQYGLQVTPIQVVKAMSAIANNGKIVEPTIIFQDGNSHIKSYSTGIPEKYYQIVREGMRMAVEEGTASGLDIPQVKIAAKTGTAEIGTTKKYVNSWVMGFFPYEKPKYVFTALMEKGPRENTVGGLYVMRQFIEWLAVYHPEYIKI